MFTGSKSVISMFLFLLRATCLVTYEVINAISSHYYWKATNKFLELIVDLQIRLTHYIHCDLPPNWS